MKAKPKSEAWVKKEVKKIFAEYGCPSPYMPAASIYGKAGGADFIECMFGYYVAIETKKFGNAQTELHKKFMLGVQARGGTYLLVYESNLQDVREVFNNWKCNLCFSAEESVQISK